MPDPKSSDAERPQENADPRGTPNPPSARSKPAAETTKPPKSPANAAIPPDKLNAENDK
jgi:hypothetical protein